jgi:predicted Zn-dependent protease with MMP-like domain
MNAALRHAPSLADIEALARQAFAQIPEALRRHVADVAIHVQDFPDDETLDTMEIDDAFGLLGLYHGVSLDQRRTHDVPQDVDRIFLYRRPILDYWCESGESLEHVVRHVLIHEIGHHFGFSDDDMHAIEESAG